MAVQLKGMTRVEVTRRLEEAIAAGQALIDTPVASDDDLRAAHVAAKGWDDFTQAVLVKAFGEDDTVVSDYDLIVHPPPRTRIYSPDRPRPKPTLAEKTESFHREVNRRLNGLRSIAGRVELYDEPEGYEPEPAGEDAAAVSPDASTIFLVHGRNREAQLDVELFIERHVSSCKLTVLADEPHASRTLIQKLIDVTEPTDFAIALLTADDEGRLIQTARGEDDFELKPRARQNVILELGYFLGRFGQGNWAILVDDTIEIPTDIIGLGYIAFPNGGDWKDALTNELRAAGITVDR